MQQIPDYSAANIKVILHTPVAIRLRPAMYVGALNSIGLLNAIRGVFDFATEQLDWQHATIELQTENILHISFHNRQFDFEEKDREYVYITNLPIASTWGASHGLLCLVGFTEFIEIHSGHQHFRYEKGEFIHLTTLSQPATDFTLTFWFDATIFGQTLRPHCFVLRNFANNLVGRNWTKHITVIDQMTQQQYDYKASSPLDLFEQMVATMPIISAPMVVQIVEPTTQLRATIVFVFTEKDEIIQSFLTNMNDKCMGGTHHKGIVRGINKAIARLMKKEFPDREVQRITMYPKRSKAILILLDYEQVCFQGATKEYVGNPELVPLLTKKVAEKLGEQREHLKEMLKDVVGKV
jgi:DNA gyrase/topoisomerase IV subunit B